MDCVQLRVTVVELWTGPGLVAEPGLGLEGVNGAIPPLEELPDEELLLEDEAPPDELLDEELPPDDVFVKVKSEVSPPCAV